MSRRKMRWFLGTWKFLPWTYKAKQRRITQEKLCAVISSLKNKSALDEEFFNHLAEILCCPVALITPYTTLISHAPYDGINFATVSRENLRLIDAFVSSEQLSKTNPPLARTFSECHIGAVISLWKPVEISWSAWLIFGENFTEQLHIWRDRQLLKELMAAIRELYIKSTMEPTLKLHERSIMIANLKRRVGQLQHQKNESIDKSLTSSGLIQNPILSDNFLDLHIGRYQRRMLEVALQQSQGRAEVASHYLGMNNINLIRLMQRLSVDRETYLQKSE